MQNVPSGHFARLGTLPKVKERSADYATTVASHATKLYPRFGDFKYSQHNHLKMLKKLLPELMGIMIPKT